MTFDPREITDPEFDVLVEATDDTVGLWSIAWRFRDQPPDAQRAATMDTLRKLLSLQIVEAGDVTKHGEFVRWDCSASDALRRIDAEWTSLGRTPNLGEIAWFVATADGRAFVDKEYDLRRARRPWIQSPKLPS